jgi:hypothetical protein
VTKARRPRPLVGRLLMGVGVIHVAITPLLMADSVRSIVEGGVLRSVEADPALAQLRGIGFWYVTAGLGLVVVGRAVDELEGSDRGLPGAVPALLGGVGVWGAALMPKSPFWVVLALAVLGWTRRRR